MENLIAGAQSVVAGYGIDVVAALLIYVVGHWASGLLSRILERLMRRARVDETLVRFTGNVVYAAALAFVALAALGKLGVQTTSFIAVLGAAGLAVGLSLQSSLSNLAGGVMMILFRPFKVGDYIEAAGTAGTVETIMIFSTQLKTPDNVRIIVPNGSIISGNIVNYSAETTRRIDLVFGCGYGDDLAKVKALLEEILAADDRILKDPAATVGVLELAENSVNFAVRPWVEASDYWATRFDLNEVVKRRFDEAGFSIPYPQRDVHLYGQAA